MGRIAAIDFGIKRMGIAISDARKKVALPLSTVHGGIKEVALFINSLQYEIEAIVIGLPLLMNGLKGAMAQQVEAFAKELEIALQIPIFFLDERLSSRHAEVSLREVCLNRKKRNERMDQVAAALLLQSYLDRQS